MRYKFPPIRKIDIEITSFCNRKCGWCPNYIYDRNFMRIMPDEMYSKIINELSENDYDGCISFTRFNESFANRDLLEKRIKEARNKVPNSFLICNTNGDYPYDGVDLDALTVMDYDNKFEDTCDKGKGFRIMRLKGIHNRADSIHFSERKRREYPCIEPQYFVGIDYEGYIYFCCNMIKEHETHKPYVFGNIMDTSITDVYYSEPAIEFRDRTLIKDFPEPCKYCQMKPSRFIRGKNNICNGMDDWLLAYPTETSNKPIDLYLKKNYKEDLIGVEIGIADGIHAKNLLDILPNLKSLYLIDPFTPYQDGKIYKSSVVSLLDGFIENVLNTESYSRIKFIRELSENAVDKIPNDVDFVYIDGNHSYRFVKIDIESYYPKVKSGGVIGGDDYNYSRFPGVTKAVDEFIKKKNLKLNTEKYKIHTVKNKKGYRYNNEWWTVK